MSTTHTQAAPAAPEVKTKEQIAAEVKAAKEAAKATADKARAEAKAAAEAAKAEAKVKMEAAKAEAKAKSEAAKAEAQAKKDAEKTAAAEKRAAEAKAKAEAKSAEKTTKVAMPMSNGITRPRPEGACGRVWAIADELSKGLGQPVPISILAPKCKEVGLNDATVRTQYARWKTFNGVFGVVAKPVVVAPAANAEAAQAA